MAKEQWAILVSFLGGCVLTNLLERDILTTYGILNDYFLSQYSYQAIDGNRLFCHILFERSKTAFTIFLLGRVMPGKSFSLLIKSAVAATSGFLITVAIICLGIRGVPICICGLFPQWLFYVVVLFYYADCRKEAALGWKGNSRMEDVSGYLLRGAILFTGMTLGVITECYVNPVLLAYVLKIF